MILTKSEKYEGEKLLDMVSSLGKNILSPLNHETMLVMTVEVVATEHKTVNALSISSGASGLNISLKDNEVKTNVLDGR